MVGLERSEAGMSTIEPVDPSFERGADGNGRVLIVERLIPKDGGDPIPTVLSDINMLVITGGQERTNAEYGRLLAAAGLRLGNIEPVSFPFGVIEGVAA